MKIIPVIDLKNGVVVHARQGDRDHYQPVQSLLCHSSNIYDVIEAFLGLYAFDTFYIADLNAILGQDNHEQLITEVMACFPKILFWIDKGYQRYDPHLITPDNYLPVLGSESYQNETVLELKHFNNRFILSLDYSMSGTLGSEYLFFSPDLWPDNIIIMTLAQVGGNQGPDLDKVTQYCKLYPQKNFIAAGGIRNVSDLTMLKQMGIRQALIASSLHSGAIKREDIEKL
ncbi:MAG: HisA/HisF-related TIM barrel protein [Methylovulum sp.]|nr:HisA/HisF-related TIM barrel protein [Methylovulum sp.]